MYKTLKLKNVEKVNDAQNILVIQFTLCEENMHLNEDKTKTIFELTTRII